RKDFLDAFWNAGEKDVTQGLDILGYRRVDQGVEVEWVNGITTISQRARYLSLLPWLLVEYLRSEGLGQKEEIEPNYDRLIALHRRLEIVVLAATRETDRRFKRNTDGLIGPDLFGDEITRLERGEDIALTPTKGGASYATYVRPCQALGLIGLEGSDGWR